MPAKRRKLFLALRVVLVLLLCLGVAGLGIWVFGPREPADLTVSFDPASIGDDPVAYLARQEADVPNLRPEAQKEIVWAYPASRARTPLAIVVIHGFSASKNELRPLPDMIAQRLHANLFFTRLAGHGRDGPAMAEASVNDWINDLAEALAIGHRIGERVIVVGNSTGATLAALGATEPRLARDMSGLVLLAPNFAVKNRFGFVLDLPFMRRFYSLFFDEEWGLEASDPKFDAVWTTRYPTVALLTMGALLRATRSSDLASIAVPTFFAFADGDRVVDSAATRRVIDAWSGPKEVVEVTGVGDPNQHILAGDLLSPGTTQGLADRISTWVGRLPPN